MTSIRLTLATAVFLSFAGQAFAALLAVRHGEDNDRMSVIYSESGCSGGVRCDRAHMGCRAPGEFFLSILNVPKTSVASWMKDAKGGAALQIDDHRFDLKADSFDGLKGKSGRVDVAFFGGERQSEIWSALGGAKAISISLGDTVLQLAGPGVAVDLKSLAAACKG